MSPTSFLYVLLVCPSFCICLVCHVCCASLLCLERVIRLVGFVCLVYISCQYNGHHFLGLMDENFAILDFSTQDHALPFSLGILVSLFQSLIKKSVFSLPDILLTNHSPRSADDSTDGSLERSKTQIKINSDGKNIWLSPVIISCSCKINVKFFPFDEQVSEGLLKGFHFRK